MAYIIKEPLIRAILILLAILISILAAILMLGLYFSIEEGKLVFSGVTNITDIYGEIIGGIFILGWGLIIPLYFATRNRPKKYFSDNIKEYFSEDIANAIKMYYNGVITKDELIQIIDREKSKKY